MSCSTINLYMLLVSMKCIGVYSRNYIIHVPKGMGAVEALDGLESMIFGVAKPLHTVAGSPNRGVNLDLIMPHQRNRNQEAHYPQPSHSIARQLEITNPPMPVSLRSENTPTTKRLAYKADLIKALEDLQKRQATKCSKNNKSCSLNKTTDSEDDPTSTTSTRSKIKKPSSLDEILELIQGVDPKNTNIKIDPIIRRYLNTITQLSERFPGRAIEVQLQLEVPKRNLVPIPSAIRRPNVRSYNSPRLIKMLRSSDVESPSSTDTTPTTTVTAAAETNPTTEAKAPIEALSNKQDPNNVPIYLDDLKKAIEEFESKALHTGCDGNSEGHAQMSPSSSSGANRRIRDIMQLIEKGIDVEFNVPQPARDGLNWLQVKLPNVL